MLSRIRFIPWLRATLTSWLYAVTKDHMKKHQKEYRLFVFDIGPEAFKRPLPSIVMQSLRAGRVGRVSRDNTKARESILEEDLAKNMSLSVHNSFYLIRESKVKGLLDQAKRLQEQREWMRAYEKLMTWEEIVINSDDEEELLRQITMSIASEPSTWVKDCLSLKQGKKKGLSVSSNEIRGHGKEILMNQNIVINMLYLL